MLPSPGAGRLACPVLIIITLLLAPTLGVAQISTATLQGKVSDGTGVLPGATVTARQVQSGFTQESTTDAEGAFMLPGLRPGTYEIRVGMDQFKPQPKTVEVLVGQTVTVDFRVTADVMYTESVSVVGSTRLVDTRKSEISTNVTDEQLRYLPQNSRSSARTSRICFGSADATPNSSSSRSACRCAMTCRGF